MIYLKSIFEGKYSNLLKEFCEESLVYLIDVGFEIGVKEVRNDSFCIKLTYNNPEKIHIFKWDDIKDHFIPFFQRLLNRWDLQKDMWWHSYMFEPHTYPCKATQLQTGIVFYYLKPTPGSNIKSWYRYPNDRESSTYQPSKYYVFNDLIYNSHNATHYGVHCMDYIFEINILVKK